MRVGYVLKKFPRLSETFILNEMLELERQGVEVFVFSLRRPDEEIVHPGVSQLKAPVMYVPNNRVIPYDLVQNIMDFFRDRREGLYATFEALLLSSAKYPWRQLGSAAVVTMEAQKQKIDHFHAHFATIATEMAYLVHQISGKPFSFTAHAKDIYRNTVDPERFARFAASARFVVTVCDANKQWIEERLVDSRARVTRLYNGIDLSYFDTGLRTPDDPPVILGVGRLVEKKGFDVLIRAAAGLEKRGIDLRTWIVGQGDQQENLEALIEELGVRSIKLLGPHPHDHVRGLMKQAAVMVLPCRVGEDGNRDALPTVLLEALAMGVPCISTPIAGVPEILDHGKTGRIVPIDDVSALEDAIVAQLADTPENRGIINAGRVRAEKLFDLKKNVAHLRGLFEGNQP